jgi:hypothetical protein
MGVANNAETPPRHGIDAFAGRAEQEAVLF